MKKLKKMSWEKIFQGSNIVKNRKYILHDCYYNSFVEVFFIISEKELIIHMYMERNIWNENNNNKKKEWEI